MSGREINAALFTLRALQLGLSVADLDEISVGFVFDLITERSFDDTGYVRRATQKDFDAF